MKCYQFDTKINPQCKFWRSQIVHVPKGGCGCPGRVPLVTNYVKRVEEDAKKGADHRI